MMKPMPVKLDDNYVPTKHWRTLEPERVEALAESILEEGLKTPIQVREDSGKDHYVLVTGLHRFEAVGALGEDTVLP
jgi:ParB-like chromosome segregation protein Spo0J